MPVRAPVCRFLNQSGSAMLVMPPVVCPSCSFSKPIAMTTSYIPEATRLSAAQDDRAPTVPPVVMRMRVLAVRAGAQHVPEVRLVDHLEELHVAVNDAVDVLHGEMPQSFRAACTASCIISGWFTSSRWLEYFVCPIPMMPTFLFFFLCAMYQPPYFSMYDDGLVLPRRPVGAVRERALRALDLPLAGLAAKLEEALDGPGRAAEQDADCR